MKIYLSDVEEEIIKNIIQEIENKFKNMDKSKKDTFLNISKQLASNYTFYGYIGTLIFIGYKMQSSKNKDIYKKYFEILINILNNTTDVNINNNENIKDIIKKLIEEDIREKIEWKFPIILEKIKEISAIYSENSENRYYEL